MKEKVVLVTGGGTGIGRAACLRFAREGLRIGVNYSRSEADAEKTLQELRDLGGRGEIYRADVSREAEVISMLERVRNDLGPVDVLVNNAGVTNFMDFGDLDAVTDEIWDRIFAVNVKGTFYCSREAARQMAEQGGGAVVNVASVSGLTGYGSCVPYSTSKAAVISLTRSLALALAPKIRVNCVSPGVVETRWVDGQEEFIARGATQTPLGRNATPADVAEVIYALAESAAFVTGQSVTVDGGRRM